MLIKLEKSLNECKIGVIGKRKHLLISILVKRKIKYILFDKEITENCDFVFGSGIYNIIDKHQIDLVKYGVFFFHEAPLPEGRGSAPIQWAIQNKRKNLTISLIKIDDGIDTGDIAYQYNMSIYDYDTATKIELKRQDGIKLCFEAFLCELDLGYIVLRKQTGRGSYSKKRTPSHSELDTSKTLDELWDDIRMCDNTKYPAFFKKDGFKVYLIHKVVKDDNK